MKCLNYILRVIIALCTLYGVTVKAQTADNEATHAFSGICGYGPQKTYIQSPGAEAGAYIYAGSALPYEGPATGAKTFENALGDSLEVIFVNHVGRHGARFLSSSKPTDKLSKYLESRALTDAGHRALLLCKALDSLTDGRWGALDALGETEQSGIGARFVSRYGIMLRTRDSIAGMSSYVPRCVMSMDEMTHSVIWGLRDTELSTGSGPRYNALLRPFDTDSAYIAFKKSAGWKAVLDKFTERKCPAAVALRLSNEGSALLQHLCSPDFVTKKHSIL